MFLLLLCTERRTRPALTFRNLFLTRKRRLRKSCLLEFAILLPYFFLPSLRKIYSPLYRIPLPLYGSGFLHSLMLAATWPTR